MQHTPSKGLGSALAMQLLRFSLWLQQQADGLDIQRWSLLPMGQLQVGYFGIDMRVFHGHDKKSRARRLYSG
ncbi:predicted protein [Lichtheimia corymbifera JMRC:FSU:9682]|uniref:Uncharacterized protein n=1 Tax=Lichtheimia corymbifera JMRC:FSU:9682 TaxID=1263082 RepID=A0A068RRS6_9FUNG|nr:predicted protein [Lichtheimia corymbifera JMRC:FSU:9682]